MPGLTIGGRGINGAAACDAWALSVVFFLLGDTLPAADTRESIGICCVTAAVTRDRYVCHDLLMALDMCYPVCCYTRTRAYRRFAMLNKIRFVKTRSPQNKSHAALLQDRLGWKATAFGVRRLRNLGH